MSITASFVDEEDPDRYVWIRRFEDEQEREALYANVYQSDRWRDEFGPEVRNPADLCAAVYSDRYI